MAHTLQDDPQQKDIWDTWIIGVHLLFYGFLLLALGMALWNRADLAQPGRVLLASLLLGLWYGLFLWRDLNYWEQRPLRLALLLPIGWLLWAWLNRQYGMYTLLTFPLFSQLFFYMRTPWSLLASVVLSLLVIFGGGSQSGSLPPLVLFIGFIMVVMLLTVYADAVSNQSVERKELLEQLTDAQAKLAAAERRAGILQERQRLSHEIHDTLAQGLAVIGMHLESAQHALEPQLRPHDSIQETAQETAQETLHSVKHYLEQAHQLSRSNLQEARRLVRALRPDMHAALDEVLQEVLEQWSHNHNIASHFERTGEPQTLPPAVQHAAVRISQEALSNVAKHARAQSLHLTLSFTDDAVLIDIADDGCGYDPHQPQPSGGESGFGLLGAKERAHALGGALMIESNPGQGTIVTVALPLLEGEHWHAEVLTDTSTAELRDPAANDTEVSL